MLKTQRPLTVVGVLLAMFMAAMETTVMGTAMPTVVEKLGGLEYYGWVGAVYLLTATVTMPLYGKLSDVFGRKPVMFLGMAVFIAGSMASGMSQTMMQLVAFRAVQGLGAGGLQPVALTIMGDIFEPAARARIQGIIGAVWGVAAMSGPLIGGVIVRTLSWRWVFFINVPVALVSAVLLALFFHEPVAKKEHTLDFAGTILLSSAIVALLLGASRYAPLVMLPVSATLLVLFVLVERRAREPVLSLALLQRRIIAVSSISAAATGSVMFAAGIYLPLYVQSVLAGTPTEAGGCMAPMLVGWPIASAVSGRLLSRTGYRPLVRTGAWIVSVASLLCAVLLHQGASMAVLGAAMFFLGTGMGLINTALLIAVQDSVPWEERGVATASMMFFRSIGGAVAVGALGAVLAAGIGTDVPASVLNGILGPDHGRRLDPGVLAQVSGQLRGSLTHVFDLIAMISVATIAAAMAFPKLEARPVTPTVATGE